MAINILVADDQVDVLETLNLTFKNEGWNCHCVRDPDSVLEALSDGDFDLVLMDLNYKRDTTSGKEGLKLLESIKALESAPPIVVMTAWGTIELAVEALRLGARDFIEKPWDNLRLLGVVRAQLHLHDSEQQVARLSAINSGVDEQGVFIAESQIMRELLQTLQNVAASDASVLITGENGTGKSQLASMLHDMSDRAQRTFLTMDVGAITESLFESELFGHVKGAFTDARENKLGRLELANGGTLFFDEVANISLAQQSRLLRVLESGEYEPVGSAKTRQTDVRFVSATNADINGMVESGDFRRDLLFRMNTVVIHVPSLRERVEDILPLAEYFLAGLKVKYRKPEAALDDEAKAALLAYHWPGNVRELAHVVERALLIGNKPQIGQTDLGLNVHAESNAVPTSISTIEDMERDLIRRTLAHFDNNISQCATSLGIGRSSLYRKLDQYGLSEKANELES